MIDVERIMATWEEDLADPTLVAQIVSRALHNRDYTRLSAEIEQEKNYQRYARRKHADAHRNTD
jgi:hypothetical protein